MVDKLPTDAGWKEYREHGAKLLELRHAEWRGIRAELITREADSSCEARMRVRQHVISLLCAGGRAGFITRIADGPARRIAQDPGWIRIVPAGRPVWSRWDGGRRTYLMVMVAPDTLTSLCSREVRMQEQIDLRDEPLQRVLDDIRRELSAPDPFTPALFEALIRQLAVRLARSASRPAPRPALRRGGLRSASLRAVMALIEQRGGDKLTVEELAVAAGLSMHHFCHAFRQSTGLPPHRYLLERRLARARHLLRDTTLSLSVVAKQAGFGGSSGFATAFRRATGLSPSAWRRTLHLGDES